jgi:curved DNA-binding protein CbpA
MNEGGGSQRAALATHPDRNLDNENATLEFQRVGTAYSVLEKYGNKDEPRGFSSPFDSSFNDGGGFGFSFRGPGASYARDEYDEEDDDEEGEQGGAEFFEFM